MSPYTTPSAVSERTASRFPVGCSSGRCRCGCGCAGFLGGGAGMPELGGVRTAISPVLVEAAGVLGGSGTAGSAPVGFGGSTVMKGGTTPRRRKKRVADFAATRRSIYASSVDGVQRLPGKVVDLLRRPLQNLAHLRQHVAFHVAAERAPVDRPSQIGKGTIDFAHLSPEQARAELRHPLEDVVDRRFVLGEVGPPGLGDLVDFLSTLLLARDREAEVNEHRERGVDGARARRIGSRETVLELLDDLVAVAGLLLQQLKDHVLEVALLEHPPTAPRPAAAAPWPSPERESARVEIG